LVVLVLSFEFALVRVAKNLADVYIVPHGVEMKTRRSLRKQKTEGEQRRLERGRTTLVWNFCQLSFQLFDRFPCRL
jgi:hypothetical protein